MAPKRKTKSKSKSKSKELAKLLEMQELLNQVEADVEALHKLHSLLEASAARQERLEQLYEKDWLKLTTSKSVGRAEREEVERLVPEGHYSIFWQDPIWNALSEVHAERLRLVKLLTAQL